MYTIIYTITYNYTMAIQIRFVSNIKETHIL